MKKCQKKKSWKHCLNDFQSLWWGKTVVVCELMPLGVMTCSAGCLGRARRLPCLRSAFFWLWFLEGYYQGITFPTAAQHPTAELGVLRVYSHFPLKRQGQAIARGRKPSTAYQQSPPVQAECTTVLCLGVALKAPNLLLSCYWFKWTRGRCVRRHWSQGCGHGGRRDPSPSCPGTVPSPLCSHLLFTVCSSKEWREKKPCADVLSCIVWTIY